MSQSDEQTALDKLFAEVEAVIEHLGDAFTFQEFIQTLAHHQQQACIDLLHARRHENSPFGSAHFFIYQRLQSHLDDLGLTMQKVNDDGDTDLFGHTTTLHQIRRKS